MHIWIDFRGECEDHIPEQYHRCDIVHTELYFEEPAKNSETFLHLTTLEICDLVSLVYKPSQNSRVN